jgi:hypothetical protein
MRSGYFIRMKKAEVQLPETLYKQVEGLAGQLHLTVPELLRQAAEQMIGRGNQPQPKANGNWQFPAGRHLGTFRAPVSGS